MEIESQLIAENDNEISSINQNNDDEEVQDALGKHSPFKTILLTSIGPFIAELAGAANSIVDSIWISKTNGEEGLAALSLCSLLDTIARAFGMFMSVAASSQLSHLRGKKKYDDINQVFADLFRTCFVIGLIVPGIMIPVISPTLKFFGAEGNVFKLGYDYLIPLLSGSVVTCINLLLCGMLQSEGRSFLYGCVQVSTFIMKMLIFDPLLMIVCKLGLTGAGLATVVSELIPAVVVGIFIIIGKFQIKISILNLKSGICKYTLKAYKVGLTQLISHLCFNIPSFFSRKYVSECATQSGAYTDALAAYNVVLRIWQIPASYAIALSIGFLPSASYAIGAHLPKRVISLVTWTLLLGFCWCSFSELILLLFAKSIATIFGRSDIYIDLATKMIRVSYMLCCTMGIQYVSMSLLQSMQLNVQSIVLSFLTQLMPVPLFSTLIYFIDKTHSIVTLMFMYSANDLFSFVVSIMFMIYPSIKLYKSKISEQVLSDSIEQKLNPGIVDI